MSGGLMAKTGPQRYPGASTAYWFGSKYPGSAMESNVVVWHTTEGTSLPSYGGGTSAPNLTAKPDFAAKRLVWYQHFDFDVSSRALVNKAGGVETNTLNVVQVEIVGTCDPATHARWTRSGIQHLYTPELPDWAIRDLAAFAKWAHEQHGVPLTTGVTFKAYPGSYGGNGVRMSNSQWSNYRGHCGHQHVPENDHGDPGAFPMTAILARAKGTTAVPSKPATNPTSETDMKLSDQIILGDWVKKQWPDDKGLADGKVAVNTALGSGYAHARRSAENSDEILKQLTALRTEVAQLRAAITKGA